MTIDPQLQELLREHHYRQLYHCSHEEYLREPAVTIDWLLAIAAAEAEASET